LPWGVVTNKAARFTDPLTRAMPLFATRQHNISGDTTPHAKPHPMPLLEAAKRLGVAPERCACMWVMMSGTSWPGWPLAWVRWLRPTVIWVKRPMQRLGSARHN
jgi:hypothetical protein